MMQRITVAALRVPCLPSKKNQESVQDPARGGFLLLSASKVQNRLLGFCFPCQLFGCPVFVLLPEHSNKKTSQHAAQETSIVSFSVDTNAASVLRLQNAPFAQINGCISTGHTQMYETVVREWLRHEEIVNLVLTAIRRCNSRGHLHEKIEKFLKESTTTQSRLTGDGDRQGIRLRVDLCMDSSPRQRRPPEQAGPRRRPRQRRHSRRRRAPRAARAARH